MDIEELKNKLGDEFEQFMALRQKCEVWTRVMGYHRPVQNFNAGKQSEFAERRFFTESACSGVLK